jgi:hypothetical protein
MNLYTGAKSLHGRMPWLSPGISQAPRGFARACECRGNGVSAGAEPLYGLSFARAKPLHGHPFGRAVKRRQLVTPYLGSPGGSTPRPGSPPFKKRNEPPTVGN